MSHPISLSGITFFTGSVRAYFTPLLRITIGQSLFLGSHTSRRPHLYYSAMHNTFLSIKFSPPIFPPTLFCMRRAPLCSLYTLISGLMAPYLHDQINLGHGRPCFSWRVIQVSKNVTRWDLIGRRTQPTLFASAGSPPYSSATQRIGSVLKPCVNRVADDGVPVRVDWQQTRRSSYACC